jgi:hypothetical protein
VLVVAFIRMKGGESGVRRVGSVRMSPEFASAATPRPRVSVMPRRASLLAGLWHPTGVFSLGDAWAWYKD